MNRLFAGSALASLIGWAAVAAAQTWNEEFAPAPDNPLVGKWNWKASDGSCPSVFDYRADGTAAVTDADEQLELSYQLFVSRDKKLYKVVETTRSSNGKPDCKGQVTELGKTSVHYVYKNALGGYPTCVVRLIASDGNPLLECYGFLTRSGQ
jgi:hypothetical protein